MPMISIEHNTEDGVNDGGDGESEKSLAENVDVKFGGLLSLDGWLGPCLRWSEQTSIPILVGLLCLHVSSPQWQLMLLLQLQLQPKLLSWLQCCHRRLDLVLPDAE